MTVISPGTADDSGTYPTRRRAPTGSATASTPSTSTRPAEGRRYPVITRMVVVLPAPLGPSSPRTSPAAMSKLTSSMARTRPKRRPTPRTWTPAVTPRSGAVVGGGVADPLGVVVAGGDRGLGHEGSSRVLPVGDREAVVPRCLGVVHLVVERVSQPVEGVGREAVEPLHEAGSGDGRSHRL